MLFARIQLINSVTHLIKHERVLYFGWFNILNLLEDFVYDEFGSNIWRRSTDIYLRNGNQIQRIVCLNPVLSFRVIVEEDSESGYESN